MKKKILFYLILSTVLVMLLCLTVGSVTTPTLSLVADSIDYETDTVKINLYIENNPGITSMKLDVGYDSDAMTLTGAVDAGKLSDWASDSPSNADGLYRLVWEGDLLKNNIVYDGLAATLTFDISSCPDGKYHVSLLYDNMNHDILNCKDKTVAFLANGCDIVVEKSNKLIYKDYEDHSELIRMRNCTVDEIAVPAEYNNKPVTVVSAGAFSGCDGLKAIRFEGDAPLVTPASDANPSFPTDIVLYYYYGTTGWTDSEYYDETTGTWNGYKLVMWAEPMVSGFCGGDETAEYDSASGAYKNLTWILYTDGKLVIDGTGEMMDYNSQYDSSSATNNTTAPWGIYTSQLKSLTIKKGITSIGNYAFGWCSGFKGSLTIPDSVTSIGDGAFGECFYLSLEGTLPENLKYIGDHAFHMSALFDNNQIVIPRSVEHVGYSAFVGCGGTEFVSYSLYYKSINGFLCNEDGTVLLACPGNKSGEVIIPEGIEEIGEYSFAYCYGVSGVHFPESLNYIDDEAFYYCTKLTGDLVIPDSVTSIGREAFYGCSSLTGVYLKGNAPSVYPANSSPSFPSDITLYCLDGRTGWTDSEYYDESAGTWNGYKLGKWAIPVVSGYCGGDETAEFDSASGAYKNLTWTIYTDSTLIIDGDGRMTDFERKENSAGTGFITSAPWGDYTALFNSLEIGDNVTSIGDNAFAFCNNISGSLDIGKNVTEIGEFAFYYCRGLEGELKLPSTLKVIEQYAFSLCAGLTGSLELPEGLTDIGKMAFGNCTGFTGKIIIPKSAENIGYCAFANMEGITGFVSRSANYKAIEGILYNSDTTELITCPRQKKGKLTIHNKVKIIDDWAFENCTNLTGELIIPEGVTSIGACAFRGCSGFTGGLDIPCSVTSIGNEAFSGCVGLTGEVTIPINVLSIGMYAFDMCDGITGFYFEGNAPAVDTDSFPADSELSFLEGLSGWTDSMNYDAVSSTWNGYKVRMIKRIGYGYCGGDETAEYDSESDAYKNISWAMYENGLLRLSGKGEMKNYSVKAVNKKKITTAFWSGYSDIDLSVEFDSNITKIGDYSFFGLNKLLSLNILKIKPVRKLMMLKAAPKEGEMIIGKYSFSDCDSLEEIDLGDNVTGIEEHAFENCTALTGEIELPESLVSIGKCAFKNVEKVEKINIPESVTEIEADAFEGNEELTVCVPKDSFAENWAKENSVIFELKIENKSIFGKIKSYNPQNILTVELYVNGEVMYSTVVDGLSGNGQVTQEFTLNDISVGKYDLVVKKSGHIDYTVTDVVVADENIDLTKSDKVYSDINMITGDVNGDGYVNSRDWAILWGDGNYLKSIASAKNKLTDINGDGSVNARDWSILWSDANYLKGKENTTFAK